jgi:hypothetical protein
VPPAVGGTRIEEVAVSLRPVDFVINVLHQAVVLAAEKFARKGIDGFDLNVAEDKVEQVKQILLENK